MNIDANITNADWPKRTPDTFADLVQKFDKDQPRHPKGSPEGGKFAKGLIRHTTAAEMKAEPLPTTLAEAEDRIRYEEKEHVFLLKDGKPFKTMGDDDKAHVRMHDATPEDLKDAVLTHNHPSGFGLSTQDGITAVKRNLLEMRAVTATGTHSIRRTHPKEWHPLLIDAIHEIDNRLKTEIGMRLHAKQLTVDEANAEHHIRMYQELENWLGSFVYTFEPKS